MYPRGVVIVGDAGVLGVDNFNEYYPSTLKRDRQAQLELAGVCVPNATEVSLM